MAKVVMLTTVDNPWNPIDNYESWFQFDVEKGYNSCSKLARIAHTSSQLTESEYNAELERAIDEILKYDFTGMYKKVEGEVD